ncbi:substrate-binding periplasmic protein [Neptuniibacter halophilus]|uniref:substrate-binding periplasmic protein n=1 Tax=Neptuniibacter halophilus TaxID=651666 RepID=UPI0025746D2C|nr:hypothetical protein [Neptuniibacter halophilus]
MLVLCSHPLAAQQTLLRLAATDWCPYTCAGPQPGIVADYVTEILARHQIRTEITMLPWSRAIAEANEASHIDGLLTAVPSESPDLFYTRTPTMSYQVCFYTREDSNWRYQTPASLSSYLGRLGYIAEYSYGEEIDRFLSEQETNNRVMELKGANALVRLLKLLHQGRVSTIIEDSKIVSWTLVSHEFHKLPDKGFRIAGCLAEQPFYLALNGAHPDNDKILEILNRAFADPENLKLRHTIEDRYLHAVGPDE